MENTTSLKTIQKQVVAKYETLYKTISHDASNPEAEYSLGIMHLYKHQYNFAKKHFINAIDQLHEDSDLYFYYALSLLDGKRPRLSNLANVRDAIQQLQQAIDLQDNGKYHYAYGLLLEDFYEAKHFNYHETSSADQFHIAKLLGYDMEVASEIESYIGGYTHA